MTTLVLIYRVGEEFRYSRYEGQICTDKFGFVLPLSSYWVEEIRNAPKSLDTYRAEEAPEAA